jgi:hypothetical protein
MIRVGQKKKGKKLTQIYGEIWSDHEANVDQVEASTLQTMMHSVVCDDGASAIGLTDSNLEDQDRDCNEADCH